MKDICSTVELAGYYTYIYALSRASYAMVNFYLAGCVFSTRRSYGHAGRYMTRLSLDIRASCHEARRTWIHFRLARYSIR